MSARTCRVCGRPEVTGPRPSIGRSLDDWLEAQGRTDPAYRFAWACPDCRAAMPFGTAADPWTQEKEDAWAVGRPRWDAR